MTKVFADLIVGAVTKNSVRVGVHLWISLKVFSFCEAKHFLFVLSVLRPHTLYLMRCPGCCSLVYCFVLGLILKHFKMTAGLKV